MTMRGGIEVDVVVNQPAYLNSFQRAHSAVQKGVKPVDVQVSGKGLQPLGKMMGSIKRDASEFERSLEASNARVLAFAGSTGVIFGLQRAFRGLLTSTIEVQKSLSEIQSLLNATPQGLEALSRQIFAVAKNTAQSFGAVSSAATELARQGLSAEETINRLSAAMTLSRLSGMEAGKSVEALTAIINGFSKELLTADQILSRLAKVEANFAVGAEDLADAAGRAGSVAQDAGVKFNEFLALVAAASQITARSGSEIANAFRTIFTRVSRGSTVDALEAIGVETKNVNGSSKDAISILKNLTKVYDTLNERQRAHISELVGGVFNINILKASMGDLSSSVSYYQAALHTANTATEEAVTRNLALNQSIDSLGKKLALVSKELGSVIGNIAFEGNLESMLGKISTGMESIINLVAGQGEDSGNKYAKGLIKGFGNTLLGPGLLSAILILVKFGTKTLKFMFDSLKSISGMNAGLERQRMLQATIADTLRLHGTSYKELLAQLGTREAVETRILGLLRSQAAASRDSISHLAGAANNRAIASAGRKVAGPVNQYADPLQQAIGRETRALTQRGLSPFQARRQIFVGHDNRTGVAVGNYIDEPSGTIAEGINRERMAGRNPFRAGLGVPNYSNPLVTNLGSEIESKIEQAKAAERAKAAEQAKTTPEQIRAAKLARSSWDPSSAKQTKAAKQAIAAEQAKAAGRTNSAQMVRSEATKNFKSGGETQNKKLDRRAKLTIAMRKKLRQEAEKAIPSGFASFSSATDSFQKTERVRAMAEEARLEKERLMEVTKRKSQIKRSIAIKKAQPSGFNDFSKRGDEWAIERFKRTGSEGVRIQIARDAANAANPANTANTANAARVSQPQLIPPPNLSQPPPLPPASGNASTDRPPPLPKNQGPTGARSAGARGPTFESRSAMVDKNVARASGVFGGFRAEKLARETYRQLPTHEERVVAKDKFANAKTQRASAQGSAGLGVGMGLTMMSGMVENKTASNIMSSTGTGAFVGSAIPVVGTAIGAGIGLAVGTLSAVIDSLNPNIEEMTEKFQVLQGTTQQNSAALSSFISIQSALSSAIESGDESGARSLSRQLMSSLNSFENQDLKRSAIQAATGEGDATKALQEIKLQTELEDAMAKSGELFAIEVANVAKEFGTSILGKNISRQSKLMDDGFINGAIDGISKFTSLGRLNTLIGSPIKNPLQSSNKQIDEKSNEAVASVLVGSLNEDKQSEVLSLIQNGSGNIENDLKEILRVSGRGYSEVRAFLKTFNEDEMKDFSSVLGSRLEKEKENRESLGQNQSAERRLGSQRKEIEDVDNRLSFTDRFRQQAQRNIRNLELQKQESKISLDSERLSPQDLLGSIVRAESSRFQDSQMDKRNALLDSGRSDVRGFITENVNDENIMNASLDMLRNGDSPDDVMKFLASEGQEDGGKIKSMLQKYQQNAASSIEEMGYEVEFMFEDIKSRVMQMRQSALKSTIGGMDALDVGRQFLKDGNLDFLDESMGTGTSLPQISLARQRAEANGEPVANLRLQEAIATDDFFKSWKGIGLSVTDDQQALIDQARIDVTRSTFMSKAANPLLQSAGVGNLTMFDPDVMGAVNSGDVERMKAVSEELRAKDDPFYSNMANVVDTIAQGLDNINKLEEPKTLVEEIQSQTAAIVSAIQESYRIFDAPASVARDDSMAVLEKAVQDERLREGQKLDEANRVLSEQESATSKDNVALGIENKGLSDFDEQKKLLEAEMQSANENYIQDDAAVQSAVSKREDAESRKSEMETKRAELRSRIVDIDSGATNLRPGQASVARIKAHREMDTLDSGISRVGEEIDGYSQEESDAKGRRSRSLLSLNQTNGARIDLEKENEPRLSRRRSLEASIAERQPAIDAARLERDRIAQSVDILDSDMINIRNLPTTTDEVAEGIFNGVDLETALKQDENYQSALSDQGSARRASEEVSKAEEALAEAEARSDISLRLNGPPEDTRFEKENLRRAKDKLSKLGDTEGNLERQRNRVEVQSQGLMNRFSGARSGMVSGRISPNSLAGNKEYESLSTQIEEEQRRNAVGDQALVRLSEEERARLAENESLDAFSSGDGMTYTFNSLEQKKAGVSAAMSRNRSMGMKFIPSLDENGNFVELDRDKKGTVSEGIRLNAMREADAESKLIDEFESSEDMSLDFGGQTYEAKDSKDKSEIISLLRNDSKLRLKDRKREASEFEASNLDRYSPRSEEELSSIIEVANVAVGPYEKEGQRLSDFRKDDTQFDYSFANTDGKQSIVSPVREVINRQSEARVARIGEDLTPNQRAQRTNARVEAELGSQRSSYETDMDNLEEFKSGDSMSYTFGTYDSKKRALDAMRSQNQESINQYSTDRFFREGGNVASAWSIKDKSLIASGIRSVAQKTADAESAEIDEFENSDNLSMEFDGQTYEAKDADEKSAIIENLRDTSQGKLENARRRAREFVSGDAVRYETTKEEKEAIEASLSEKQAPYMQEAERIERFSRVGRMSYDLRDNQKDLVYGSERERIESANRQRVSQIESNRMEQPEEPLVPLQNKREQMEAEANVGGFARIETAKEAFAERIRQRVAQNEDLRTRANDRSFESMIEPAEQRRAKMARETATRELAVDNRTIGIDTRRISEEFNMDFAEMARELEAALASQLGTVGKNLALEYTGSIEVEMRNMPPNINTQVLEETIKRLQQQLTQLKSQVDNQQRTSEGKPAVVR